MDGMNYRRDLTSGFDINDYANRQMRECCTNQGIIPNWRYPGAMPKIPTFTIGSSLTRDIDVPKYSSKTATCEILKTRADLRSDKALSQNC